MSVRTKVLGRRILLKPLEAAETTAGGVVLAAEVREKESRGMVVAIGDLQAGIDPSFEVGDVVVFAEHGSTPYAHPVRVSIDNDETGKAEDYIVAGIEDVLLILEEPSA